MKQAGIKKKLQTARKDTVQKKHELHTAILQGKITKKNNEEFKALQTSFINSKIASDKLEQTSNPLYPISQELKKIEIKNRLKINLPTEAEKQILSKNIAAETKASLECTDFSSLMPFNFSANQVETIVTTKDEKVETEIHIDKALSMMQSEKVKQLNPFIFTNSLTDKNNPQTNEILLEQNSQALKMTSIFSNPLNQTHASFVKDSFASATTSSALNWTTQQSSIPYSCVTSENLLLAKSSSFSETATAIKSNVSQWLADVEESSDMQECANFS